jgi:hypothetical protein
MPAEGSPLSACKNMPVTSVDVSDINSERLCLEGLLYSKISKVHVVMDLDSLANLSDHPFLGNFKAVSSMGGMHSNIDLSTFCVLARNLTAGCNSALKDVIATSTEEQNTFYSSCLMILPVLRDGLDDMNFRREFPFQESFYDQAEIVCTNRRLVQTTDGNFGLGPLATRKGDIVVILFGGDAPYVLRPCNDSYLLIGQVYKLTYSTIEPAIFPWHDQLSPHHVMSQQRNAIAIQEERRLELALQAYISGQFKRLRRAAAAFNVTHQRLSDRLHGIISRTRTRPNYQKLTATEERTIIQYILDLDS